MSDLQHHVNYEYTMFSMMHDVWIDKSRLIDGVVAINTIGYTTWIAASNLIDHLDYFHKVDIPYEVRVIRDMIEAQIRTLGYGRTAVYTEKLNHEHERVLFDFIEQHKQLFEDKI